jgi:hypothetical protein
MATPTKTWRRLARGLASDGNPLRRRSDRIESWLRPGAIIAFLVLAPLVALAAAMWVNADAAVARHAQQSWHQVPATLLVAAPGPMQPDYHANSWLVWTRARWTFGGATRTGDIPAPSGTKSGATVSLWLDRSGRVQRPPSSPSEISERAMAAGFVAVALLAVLLVNLALATQRLLDWRRLAAWDTAWRTVGPRWSRAP